MKTTEVRVNESEGIGFRQFEDIAIDAIMDKTGTHSTWDRPKSVSDACDRAMKKLGARQVDHWYENSSREYVWQFVIWGKNKTSLLKRMRNFLQFRPSPKSKPLTPNRRREITQMIILSDIHGCYRTLMALLAKCPSGHEIAVTGDLIDRGPDSKAVVSWAIENNISVTLGNHEHMALDAHKTEDHDYQSGIWEMNGGGDCLRSYDSKRLPEFILGWMRNLPAFIARDGLLISHTGHGDREDLSLMERVWVRDEPRYKDSLYRVFGHTPAKTPTLTTSSAMIDTGCAYKDRGYGVLTALIWTGKNTEVSIIQQDNIE